MKNISIIGIGVSGDLSITIQGENLIKNTDFIIGAKRVVEAISTIKNPLSKSEFLIDSNKIFDCILNSNSQNIVVLMSGDTGFHSGATKLALLLDNPTEFDVEIIAGISSLQYFAAKIKRSWQDVFLSSAHGVECNFLGQVLTHKECFFLVGGKITAEILLDELFKAGFKNLTIYIGENLGYYNEKITTFTLDKMIDFTIDKLSVVWVIRPEIFLDNYTGMLGGDDFIRGKVPITKSAIRNHAISILGRNQSDLILYDIGAGTGSIAIELALANPLSTVFAFEVNPVALDLIKQNREKFQAYNLVIVEGDAPKSLENISPADKVFIGGSKGNMNEIFTEILSKNPNCFLVVSAIAVETFAITINLFNEKNIPNFEVVQLAVARTKSVANYNMLIGENPTFLISGGVINE